MATRSLISSSPSATVSRRSPLSHRPSPPLPASPLSVKRPLRFGALSAQPMTACRLIARCSLDAAKGPKEDTPIELSAKQLLLSCCLYMFPAGELVDWSMFVVLCLLICLPQSMQRFPAFLISIRFETFCLIGERAYPSSHSFKWINWSWSIN